MREMSDKERRWHLAQRLGGEWATIPGALRIYEPPKPEPAPTPDPDEDPGDCGELSNVSLYEDNWEVNPETGKTEWVPYMLASPPMPGYPGPDRYAWWPGRFKDGKRVKPEDVEADIEDAKRLGLMTELDSPE